MKIGISSAVIFVLISCLIVISSYGEEQSGTISLLPSCNSNKGEYTRLSESGYVQIGGIKQWITIKGTSCSKPIILIVHGGPGNPLSLYHESLYHNWENEFTIVHWDQRGSGKTYEANQEVGELTLEQLSGTALSIDLLVSDGLEVTDYIRNKLGHDKLILSGTSWGSVLAVKMAITAPRKYHFYVGLSQLVNYNKNIKESYKLVYSLAVARKDLTALEILGNIGDPPWTNPRSFGRLRRIIKRYEEEVVSESPEFNIASEYNSEKTSSAYSAGEEFSFVKFVGLKGDGMAQKIALDECCIEFKIPIYIIQGESDLLTAPRITKEFFDSVKAPSKEYIQLKRSGHNPNKVMLNKQLEVMKVAIKRFISE